MAEAVPAFRGWTGDFQGFFLGLRIDNSKPYFDSHRRQYECEVKGPMLALLAELESEFGAARVSRPNRDIRFSPDKTPYKTNIYGSSEGGYVALDAEGLRVAAGRYHLDRDCLERFRSAVAADGSGSQLAALVNQLRASGYEIDEPVLKRVPAPYPKDHPREELLRHKRLIYWRQWEVGPWIATAGARARVERTWREGAALMRWFHREVGPDGARAGETAKKPPG